VLLIVFVHLGKHVREHVDGIAHTVAVDEFLVFLFRDLRVHFKN
jgi:uncharacterized membrane protein YkgB